MQSVKLPFKHTIGALGHTIYIVRTYIHIYLYTYMHIGIPTYIYTYLYMYISF